MRLDIYGRGRDFSVGKGNYHTAQEWALRALELEIPPMSGRRVHPGK
jgi:hypothetical protein